MTRTVSNRNYLVTTKHLRREHQNHLETSKTITTVPLSSSRTTYRTSEHSSPAAHLKARSEPPNGLYCLSTRFWRSSRWLYCHLRRISGVLKSLRCFWGSEGHWGPDQYNLSAHFNLLVYHIRCETWRWVLMMSWSVSWLRLSVEVCRPLQATQETSPCLITFLF